MEIMVSVIVFAIVVIAILNLLHYARGHIVRMGMRRNALVLAEEKLEQLRAGWFEDADLADGDHGPEVVQVSEHIAGSRTWSVTWNNDPADGGSGSDQDYKEVVVGVAWSWEVSKRDSVALSGRFYP
jgi:Tfp pilus assembly protein PilV